MKLFCKSLDYVCRLDNAFFDDTPFKDEYRLPVYKFARWILDTQRLNSVLDLGCGSGYKLIHQFRDKQTIGVDLQPTIDFCKRTYPDRIWTTPQMLNPVHPDILISADVIEHIPDPDMHLDMIERQAPKHIVFSTPALNVLGLGTEAGPPRNISHVREWDVMEFREYIGSRFKVIEHFLDATTQIIHCQLK